MSVLPRMEGVITTVTIPLGVITVPVMITTH